MASLHLHLVGNFGLPIARAVIAKLEERRVPRPVLRKRDLLNGEEGRHRLEAILGGKPAHDGSRTAALVHVSYM